ncbi:MAG: tRNA (adenosine(37)-N6)-dimethylallyltransferase MiaA [Deltaproteobacteria bacterium]|nr:tRNA (adenosine(37)-N6)-dimethylallyltransferase MiaA [Deltaproteobacteria bacterium]
MKKIITLFGPTASSKSKIAIELATRYNGEIVNSDSRQFFKFMEIGTASPSAEEKRLIPHHLYNILEPNEKVDAGLFVKMADDKIADISLRNKLPIIVGGTGLYLKALTKGLAKIPIIPNQVREHIKEMIKIEGLTKCYEYLREKDPNYAKKISPNDKQRIERALEVIYFTGEKFSSFHNNHNFCQKRYEYISICIMPKRDILYERINKRTHDIFHSGIIEETQLLISKGYENTIAFNAIGYNEAYKYITGKISLKEAIELTAQRTRQYAKRQITWFKKADWTISTEPENINYIIDYLNSCIK